MRFCDKFSPQKLLPLIIAACVALVCPQVQADLSGPAISPTKPSSSPSDVRAEVFDFLSSKTGTALVVPVLSGSQTPLQWLEARQAQPDKIAVSLFLLTGETLLLSQQLLGAKDETQKRRGLLLASESANFVCAHLPKEKWLLARVYQGFILPNISLANVERWRDPSRQRLLEAAITAFGNAGETDIQKGVLEWLLGLATKPRSSSVQVDGNTLDWTRGTLASLLMQPADAPRADLERALRLLKSIRSPDMKGFKHLQTLLEVRLQNIADASSNSSGATTTP